MQRNVCNHAEDSAKCCIAGLLELHNRDVETPAALTRALQDRGLVLFATVTPGPISEEWLKQYRDVGFWLLTGPTEHSPAGTSVMLGDRFYHRPFPEGYKVDDAGPWIVTVFVPFNPMYVRRHGRPTA